MIWIKENCINVAKNVQIKVNLSKDSQVHWDSAFDNCWYIEIKDIFYEK